MLSDVGEECSFILVFASLGLLDQVLSCRQIDYAAADSRNLIVME
jgi:hypothetical protein